MYIYAIAKCLSRYLVYSSSAHQMDISKLRNQEMAEKLKADMSELLKIISGVPVCTCEHTPTSGCFSRSCTPQMGCEVAIRQTLHRIRYASIAAFNHELTVIGTLSPALYSLQKERLDSISEIIDDVMCQYATSKNCIEAIAGLGKLVSIFINYVASLDLTLTRLLQVPSEPSTFEEWGNMTTCAFRESVSVMRHPAKT